MKKQLFLFALFAFYWQTYAQAPSNDNCANAVSLSVNPGLNCTGGTSGTLSGATDSGFEADTGDADDDVWYSFVATATAHKISLSNVEGDEIDLAHEVMGGTCGSLTILSSADLDSSIVSGLTVGTTYYVRVYSYYDDPASTTFDICVSTLPALTNDNCATAIALTANPNLTCSSMGSGVLVGATDSGIETETGTADDDVWYSFVATAASHRISLKDVEGDTTDLVHEVLGGTCGTLAILSSSDNDTSLISGLTVGTTYYIRVFSYGSDPAVTTFNICITTLPTLTNDECADAIALTVNTDASCSSRTGGILAGATDSGITTATGSADDDVWYSFVATATSHRIKILDAEGDLTDLVHEVMDGACGSLVTLTSNDNDSSLATGLTVGTTYYIRIFSYSDTVPESTTFNICVGVPPAAPANDDCTGAISVAVNTNNSCTLRTSGTVVSATDSGEVVSGVGTADDDVWFTFTATATSHRIKLLNVEGDETDLVHEALEGSCGGQLLSLQASDSDSSLITGLTIGTTYYLRVFTYGDSGAESTTFDICIGIPPTAPANDECAGAVALTVNSDLLCTSKTAGTLVSATNSGIGADTGTADDDVWFSFVATSTTHKISLLNSNGDQTDLVHEVMDGNCNALTILNSSDDDISTASGLTIGTTYYVRVFSYGTNAPESTAFDICIGTLPPAPANDECTGAVVLTVNPDLSCTATTAGTLASATDSGVETENGEADDDVWYSFVATATSHKISILNVEGDITYLVHELMDGTCTSLISLDNSTSESSFATGLTVGATYYVRVYSYYDDIPESTTFDICIGSQPPAPANDDCNDAVALTVNTDGSCTAKTAGTIAGATDSGEGNNGSGTPDDDVWYTFVATATSHKISLLDVDGDPSDLVHEVLQGMCGGQLESLNVSDPDSSIISGLVVGTTYYVRVFSYGEDIIGSTTFDICVGILPPPPANDDCANAITLTAATTYAGGAVNSTIIGATDSAATTSIPDPDCASYSGGDVWYKVVIPADGKLTIQTGNPTGSSDTSFDSGLAVYSGTCDALELVECDDDSGSSGNYSRINLTGRTPGETVYIRVWEYSNDEEELFSIGAWSPTLSTPAFDSTNFRAYPNPVSGVLNLSYDQDISDVQVFNLLGQNVASKVINSTEGKIDMSALPTGSYLVKVTSQGQTKTIKVVKQ
ncbi:T9SS type A sorting domain-containing protein [Flavobacterium sp. WW92]|uniref:T9SS type A sorting domain-containing protein n=1 Tax=unclassified Flavobacterium TaxID=196869 RepID=UPI002224EC88|nr:MULTISPECIES: T9SS type A sorting domain-containing protein [unclassified Flavobacterium]WDO14432.1 T9SS type A sorting domain-containing protein [Flavobacterium sp. WW92]